MLKLCWSIVALLLAAWSLLVWLGHALLAALLAGAGRAGVPELAVPEAWTAWLPLPLSEALTQALQASQPLLQGALAWLPGLSGGAALLAWAVWLVGALMLAAAGALTHVGWRWWQRSQPPLAPHLQH